MMPIVGILVLIQLFEFGHAIRVDTSKSPFSVDERFLSVALDSHLIAERWKNFDFSSPRVLNMASALSPAYMRLGGSAADIARFEVKGERREQGFGISVAETTCYCTTDIEDEMVCEDLKNFYKTGNYTLTSRDWDALNTFAQRAGWTFLFDFNSLLRKDGKWDPTNARQLLEYSSTQNFTNIAWQLGNEPNWFPGQFGVNVSAYQLGKDYLRLRHLLDSFPLYRNSLLVGPEVNDLGSCKSYKAKDCAALRFLDKVIKGAHGSLDAVTWHHYYMDGHNKELEDYTSVSRMDNLGFQMKIVGDFMTKVANVSRPLWLGETSTASGGGTHGLSNRYVAGFYFLDKLGLAAIFNYSVIVRQTFYHGCYALLGEDLLPYPDFWVSILHKRLVGRNVLTVENNDNSKLRVYAHCTKAVPHAVTLFAINMSNDTIFFNVEGQLEHSSIEHYILAPRDDDLTSRDILLNGVVLKMNADETLPRLLPSITGSTNKLFLNAFEMAFWVFPEAAAEAC